MTDTPNNRAEALAYARAQRDHLDPPAKYGSTWNNDCQAFVHVAYGLLTGGFATAFAQWVGMDAEDRHPTSDLSKAPVGALLFSRGSNPAGHVWLAAFDFPNGTPGSFSTDMNAKVFGGISKVPRNAPRDRWSQDLLGWGTSVNGYRLDLSGSKPARAIEPRQYKRVARAINNLENALENAVRGDREHDARLIRTEVRHQKELYSELRHH